MRSLWYSERLTDQRLRALSLVQLRKAKRAAQNQVYTFSGLVPWPALAAAWARDVERIEAELTTRGMQ